MAFASGSVSSLADLRLALIAGCTANGWTLAGTVLSKGSCYVSLPAVDANGLRVTGGTGISAGALAGVGPLSPGFLDVTGVNLTWPASYRLHMMGNEVYLLLRYSVDYYQWMAFGCSPAIGLPGTGNWYGASFEKTASRYLPIISPTNGAGYDAAPVGSAALFWQIGAYPSGYGINSFAHHGLTADIGGWSGSALAGAVGPCRADAIGPANPLIARQPNAGNGESQLVPIRPVIELASKKVAAVVSLSAARFLRIDNYAAEQIITLGSDRWCVYPWLRKNAAARDGGSSIPHSGTMGWAIRYDGP